MKKKNLITCSLLCFVFMSCSYVVIDAATLVKDDTCAVAVNNNMVSNGSVINKLTRIEAASGSLVTQVVLEFARPLYYEKEECETQGKNNAAKQEVTFYFPGVKLKDFMQLGVLEKIRALPVVNNASVVFEKLPTERVVMTVIFEANKYFLLLTKMEEPNFLVIDIFNKEAFKKIENYSTTLRTTQNAQKPKCLQNLSKIQGRTLLACLGACKKKDFCSRTRLT